MITVWRIFIHFTCCLPFGWLGYGLLSGNDYILGSDPIKEIEHFLGYTALIIFFMMFWLGIFLQMLGKNHYQILRRPLGLWAFMWATLHVASYLILELGLDFTLFWQEIIHRPYLLMGFIAFVVLSIMALTSLPTLKQRLGKRWFTLHQFAYPAIVLATLHYYQSVKGVSLAAILITSGVMLILFWKYYPFLTQLLARCLRR